MFQDNVEVSQDTTTCYSRTWDEIQCI